jgi:hypothetical protein
MVALLCVALAVMLSGQSYISLMDRIEHAHHHAHFANPLAGDIAFCFGDHDACGHTHHDGADASHHHHSNGANSGTNEHQHGDAAIMFLAAQSFVLSLCPIPSQRCELEPPTLASFHPRGPDHPPKSALELRV